ncbi:MAG: hypothetical protein V1912_02055 [bacterium]
MATLNAGSTKIGRAWIIIPAVIVAIAVIGLVVSSFQKEAGLVAPSDSGRAAVAAAAEVDQALAAGTDSDAYADFSAALLVATVAHKNMVVANPADTRLDHLLVSTLDCFAAVREAWQAQLGHAWDPQTQGRPEYWSALHPFVEITTGGPLAPEDIRRLCGTQAAGFLEKAIDLAD